MTDLGILPGYTTSYGRGINNAGQVVGTAEINGSNQRAFLYSNGQLTDLGTLGGSFVYTFGNDINDAGQVVGAATTSILFPSRAFLYSNGHIAELNGLIDPTLRVMLSEATAISNSGQIVANGVNASGSVRAFLLTPTSTVPEPSTLLLFGVGLLGLSAWRVPKFSSFCWISPGTRHCPLSIGHQLITVIRGPWIKRSTIAVCTDTYSMRSTQQRPNVGRRGHPLSIVGEPISPATPETCFANSASARWTSAYVSGPAGCGDWPNYPRDSRRDRQWRASTHALSAGHRESPIGAISCILLSSSGPATASQMRTGASALQITC